MHSLYFYIKGSQIELSRLLIINAKSHGLEKMDVGRSKILKVQLHVLVTARETTVMRSLRLYEPVSSAWFHAAQPFPPQEGPYDA